MASEEIFFSARRQDTFDLGTCLYLEENTEGTSDSLDAEEIRSASPLVNEE